MQFPQEILILITSLSLFWSLILSVIIFLAYSRYKHLTANISQKDFAAVLVDIKKNLKTIDDDLHDFRKSLSSTNKALKPYLQKLGFVRYNPFGNTGGDQSFCLCLLDQQDNGILITSLHARDYTRMYTKEIRHGKPVDKSKLSQEEAQCIKNALSWSSKK